MLNSTLSIHRLLCGLAVAVVNDAVMLMVAACASVCVDTLVFTVLAFATFVFIVLLQRWCVKTCNCGVHISGVCNISVHITDVQTCTNDVPILGVAEQVFIVFHSAGVATVVTCGVNVHMDGVCNTGFTWVVLAILVSHGWCLQHSCTHLYSK